MNAAGQIVVLAKQPIPGRVKTRLCPPCTPAQAANVAAAALADTLETVSSAPAALRTLVIAGHYPTPPGWLTMPQRGGELSDRLADAFADTAVEDAATVLVGMDTPQVTPALLGEALAVLAAPDGPDAAIGLATDGGWWALGLRWTIHAQALRDIPTSTPTTGADTLAALHGLGLSVTQLPELRDVDTAADAHAVAARCRPDSRFSHAVASHVPAPAGAHR